MPLKAQRVPHLKLKQNICGCLFILAYLCLAGYHAGRYFGLFDASVGYMLPRSVFAVSALILCYNLASNLASEIFAMAQCAIDLFFAIAMPFMLVHDDVMQSLDKWIFVTCTVFCLLSLYFWVILLNNNYFRNRDIVWILLIPLLQALDICIYLTYLNNIRTVTDMENADFFVPEALRIAKMVVALIAPVGAWKLCHSPAFSSNNDGLSMPSFSPFNRYGLICGLMVVAAVLLS